MMITERHREVLHILISDYIATAEPVGSRTVSKWHPARLSPATIRNIMADLTDMGFLSQPHTSAGRVPTTMGLQYYVDTLLSTHQLSSEEQTLIRERCGGAESGVQQFLHQTTSALSVLSRYVGLVVTPGWKEIVFKHIEFLKLSRGRILGIFVSQGGLVQNQIIEFGDDLTYPELEKMNNFCNRAFTGLNLAQAREKIRRELETERIDYDQLLRHGLEFSDVLLGSVPAEDVVMEGKSQLMGYQEYAKVEHVQELMNALEEKERLLTLLERCRESNGMKIYIGADATEPLSIVSAPYLRCQQKVGWLGVIGPKRMDYSHVVPIVDFTAKLVSDYLETHG